MKSVSRRQSGSSPPPPENLWYAGYYAGFAGPHKDYGRTIARIGGWGRGGQDLDWLAASTVPPANLTQQMLEPLMRARAEELAPNGVFFNHTFIDFEESANGVVTTIEDRSTGERYQVASRYLLACDGGRAVGPKLGVRMEGHLAVATSISVHFSADLSAWFHDSEALHCSILNPDFGVPCVLLQTGPRQWGAHCTEWGVHLMSFAGDHKTFDDETAVATVKKLLGLPDLAMKVHVINRWPLDAVVASHFKVGRAFIIGDAAHRMPPTGSHGLNTAVQDAYNLAWKLAAVLKGSASDELLDTYERERRPVAERNVATSFAGWHKNRDLVVALGFGPRNSPEENWANIRRVWSDGPDGEAARRTLAQHLTPLVPNFNALHNAFGYTYESGAIVPDGTEKQMTPDVPGSFKPSTRPGHSMPDVWIENLVGHTALGDLVGRGRFVLIAGADGRAWADAARLVAQERGLPLDAFTLGNDETDQLDICRSWSRVCEHGASGAILVRPDRFVAWRAQKGAPDCAAELRAVFDHLLISSPYRSNGTPLIRRVAGVRAWYERGVHNRTGRRQVRCA